MYSRSLIVTLLISLATIFQSGSIEAKPLKIYILCGQSNMQGHAKLSTFPAVSEDPKTAAIYKEITDKNGKPVECRNVYISYLTDGGWVKKFKPIEKNGPLTAGFGGFADGSEIGPEFTFGIYMEKLTNSPILLIKTAWGGRDLNTDFRSPSSGPFEFPKALLKRKERDGEDLAKVKSDKVKATGKYYRLMIDHVKKVLADPKKYYPAYNKKDGLEIAGFVWFQGFNDLHNNYVYPYKDTPDQYSLYTDLLVNFIKDVRKDLKTPKMPFVIGVLGVSGDLKSLDRPRLIKNIKNFRTAMAAPANMPEFKGNVVAVHTEKYWDDELGKLDFRLTKNVKEKLKKSVKKKRMNKNEREAERKRLMDKEFTKEEQKILKQQKSNAFYHYLGSAKILTQIGKAFAEAMNKLEK